MTRIQQIAALNCIVNNAHENIVAHGFYEDDPFNFGEKIALISTELSESLERWRSKDPKAVDEHVPKHYNVMVELADAQLRINDLAGYLQKLGYGNFAEALFDKHDYNTTRPRKHGKNF